MGVRNKHPYLKHNIQQYVVSRREINYYFRCGRNVHEWKRHG